MMEHVAILHCENEKWVVIHHLKKKKNMVPEFNVKLITLVYQ